MENIKCVIVGDGSVGKTTLLIRYTSNVFVNEYVPTIFDNYACSTMYEQTPINLVLWDTAGQEDYDRLRPLSYPNTDMFVLCFSTINASSFHNIRNKWIPELSSHCPNVPIVLVGTKSDLKTHETVLKSSHVEIITDQTVNLLMQDLNLYAYVECSSLTGENVSKVFDTVTECFMKKKTHKTSTKKCAIL